MDTIGDVAKTCRYFGIRRANFYRWRSRLRDDGEHGLGKITIGAELGWGEALQARGVAYGRHGIRAAAIRQGQLAGDIAPFAHHADDTQTRASMIARECFVPAPHAGHYELLMECGARVAKADAVGLLHDFCRIDLPPMPVRAGLDGVVIA